ncbi:MAG: substrate-binding domain-containing protein [Chloroflexi bacterium]|nr:substrate-binding domain-containing protein [Chloroflexota bacterium]
MAWLRPRTPSAHCRPRRSRRKRLAVEHLIELGHRRIGCITNAHPDLAVDEAVGRLDGYRADEVALGALRAARQANLRVPSSLSIVGFDDLPMARYVVPALTTVHVPARASERLTRRC